MDILICVELKIAKYLSRAESARYNEKNTRLSEKDIFKKKYNVLLPHSILMNVILNKLGEKKKKDFINKFQK